MSKKAENQEKEIASEAFLPSLSDEYTMLFRELLEHLEHDKYVRQAYRTNAKIFQTNRRQVTLAATSIY